MRKEEIRLYNCWRNMKSRCKRQRADHGETRYKHINYCDEWEKYEPFEKWALQNDYNDNLQLDRINNNKVYSPTNCRWITNKENSNNRSNNRSITYNGKTQTVSQWAEETGIKYKTLIGRLNKPNWTLEEIFKAPLGHNLDYATKNYKRDEKGRITNERK